LCPCFSKRLISNTAVLFSPSLSCLTLSCPHPHADAISLSHILHHSYVIAVTIIVTITESSHLVFSSLIFPQPSLLSFTLSPNFVPIAHSPHPLFLYYFFIIQVFHSVCLRMLCSGMFHCVVWLPGSAPACHGCIPVRACVGVLAWMHVCMCAYVCVCGAAWCHHLTVFGLL
jgi:hypothetical protein